MLPVSSLIAIVTVLNLYIAGANVVAPRDLPIRYPEPLRATADDDDNVPASCRDLNYCTVKPKNYPEEKFNNMFKDYKVAPQPELVPDLSNRYGEENCDSIITNEPLYQVREKRHKQWRTVVQAPGHAYIQRVLLEKCSNEGVPCFQSICMEGEFKPVCIQKYYTWELLVSKGDNNETEMIKAELPGSCACHAQKVDFKS